MKFREEESSRQQRCRGHEECPRDVTTFDSHTLVLV